MKLFQILVQIVLWGFAYWVMVPEPLGLGSFKVPVFNGVHAIPFFTYGFLFNFILVYTYALGALPPYFTKKRFSYFLLINLSFLLGFALVETVIDHFYMGYIYEKYNYEEPVTSIYDWVIVNLIFNGLALIGANFYGFSFAWLKEQGLRRQVESEKLQAELSALKHQVNPHFLFNVLNSLYGLSLKNDDEETAMGIMQLSEMMRYMLYEANDDTVSLEKEIDYIKNYIELQRLRLNDQTTIRFDVEGNIQQKQIAPMMLIPFVENACKHGVSTVFPSKIDIFIRVTQDTLMLLVKNPIHPRTAKLSQDEGGIGLKNVHKRLNLFYPQAHQLSIEESDQEYEVSLTLAL